MQQRDLIALGQIEILLDKQIDGKVALSKERLDAIKIRYDKLRPALSAQELTTVDPESKLTEEQLLEQMAQFIANHPDIVQQALAAKARKQAELSAQSSATNSEMVTKSAKNAA